MTVDKALSLSKSKGYQIMLFHIVKIWRTSRGNEMWPRVWFNTKFVPFFHHWGCCLTRNVRLFLFLMIGWTSVFCRGENQRATTLNRIHSPGCLLSAVCCLLSVSQVGPKRLLPVGFIVFWNVPPQGYPSIPHSVGWDVTHFAPEYLCVLAELLLLPWTQGSCNGGRGSCWFKSALSSVDVGE